MYHQTFCHHPGQPKMSRRNAVDMLYQPLEKDNNDFSTTILSSHPHAKKKITNEKKKMERRGAIYVHNPLLSTRNMITFENTIVQDPLSIKIEQQQQGNKKNNEESYLHYQLPLVSNLTISDSTSRRRSSCPMALGA